MPKTPPERRFIVRKYVMARTAVEALQKESSVPPDDVWVDDEYRTPSEQPSAIGFHAHGDRISDQER
jgi:hypothetical protein